VSKKVGHNPRTIQNVFVLLLLSLFACLSTFLVTIGAQAYRSAVERADENNATRIMTAVVRSAVWAEDGGEVKIENFDAQGIKTLSIITEVKAEDSKEIYYTRIYCMDGKLYVCYQGDTQDFDPEYGEELCDLKGFEPSIEGKMLTVKLTAPNDAVSEIHTYLRAGGADE
jgi:hypothetical protein